MAYQAKASVRGIKRKAQYLTESENENEGSDESNNEESAENQVLPLDRYTYIDLLVNEGKRKAIEASSSFPHRSRKPLMVVQKLDQTISKDPVHLMLRVRTSMLPSSSPRPTAAQHQRAV